MNARRAPDDPVEWLNGAESSLDAGLAPTARNLPRGPLWRRSHNLPALVRWSRYHYCRPLVHSQMSLSSRFPTASARATMPISTSP